METTLEYVKSRRKFLKNMSALAVLSAFSTLGGCEELAAKIRNRPTRRRIRTGSAQVDDMMQVYADAVAAMKGLSNSDRRNWARQAQIHASFCPHGSWAFLPWHRAYLMYFEKICQKLTNRPDFGLPYWNWAIDSPIPSQFNNSASSLFNPSRNPGAGANTSIASHSNMESILSQTNFLLFASSATSKGQLESGPHDTTHGGVGGNMGSVPTAALDPVFWTHHCMMDYCWVDWNLNRDNPNTNDPAWTNLSFNNQFCDGDGVLVTNNVSAILTTLYPLLTYQYENSQIGNISLREVAMVSTQKELNFVQKKLEKGAPVAINLRKKIPILRGLVLPLEKGMQAAPLTVESADIDRLLAQNSNDRAILNIGFVTLPENSDFFVRVYINNDSAQPDPGMESIYYAGSFGFFTGQEGSKAPNYIVDVTETIARLKKAGKIDAGNNLNIQLTIIPISGEQQGFSDKTLSIEDISLDISTVSIK